MVSTLFTCPGTASPVLATVQRPGLLIGAWNRMRNPIMDAAGWGERGTPHFHGKINRGRAPAPTCRWRDRLTTAGSASQPYLNPEATPNQVMDTAMTTHAQCHPTQCGLSTSSAVRPSTVSRAGERKSSPMSQEASTPVSPGKTR